MEASQIILACVSCAILGFLLGLFSGERIIRTRITKRPTLADFAVLYAAKRQIEQSCELRKSLEEKYKLD